MKYKYFVSCAYQDASSGIGYANHILDTERKLDSDLIEEMTTWLGKWLESEKVVIISITQIKR